MSKELQNLKQYAGILMEHSIVILKSRRSGMSYLHAKHMAEQLLEKQFQARYNSDWKFRQQINRQRFINSRKSWKKK